MRPWRVGILALQHESNTFLSRPTTVADFAREQLLVGSAIRRHYHGAHHEVSGFFEGLDALQIEAVPLFAANTTPSGTVESATYSALLEMMLQQLNQAPRLDGLLVAPHGAGVSEAEPDMDGHWLSEVRKRVGDDVPIVATIDPHANLSPRMVAATNAIIAYRTNPHTDQKSTGLKAASLLAQTLKGNVHPTMSAAFPAFAMNIAAQHTASPPLSDLMALADAQLQRPGVLSNSVVLGFPYADVAEMGTSFIAVTDNDAALAGRMACEMETHLLQHREQFNPHLPDVDAALTQAMAAEAPVCLLDLGDNVGGGSAADGTVLAQAILQRDAGPSLVCLFDPSVAQQAWKSGVGGTFDAVVGGKTDQLHGSPLKLRVTVRSLNDGTFEEPMIRHGARPRYDMGPTAVLQSGRLTLIVNSVRTPPFSLGQVTSCGLRPQDFRLIVAKGVNAPLAAYGPVCKTFIKVDTPGVTTASMNRLHFEHRRRPMFPFEQ